MWLLGYKWTANSSSTTSPLNITICPGQGRDGEKKISYRQPLIILLPGFSPIFKIARAALTELPW